MKRMTLKRTAFVIFSLAVVLVLFLVWSYKSVIFQRGNPVPYLYSALSLSEDTPYMEVGEDTGIYISSRGECPELFTLFEENTGMEFLEQAGSGFIFTNGLENKTISSEIYLKYFTVWQTC